MSQPLTSPLLPSTASSPDDPSGDLKQQLRDSYRRTRSLSLELCSCLEAEDFRVQSMPDVSPPWWNLGHTTWFFAKNLLEARVAGGPKYKIPAELGFALNSYYETFGERVERHRRGLLTRPTTEQILEFRRQVDERIEQLLTSAPEPELASLAELMTVGIQHEQQHQELLVTELKHIFFTNPARLRPCLPIEPLDTKLEQQCQPPAKPVWLHHEAGVVSCGASGDEWCWDNELPRHRRFLEPFEISDRPVTVSQYQAFIDDGGYTDPLLWLASGWAFVQEHEIEAPLYWLRDESHAGDTPRLFTLAGSRKAHPDEPVCHLSYYEADAYATWLSHQGDDWKGARLPTEFEWEAAVARFDPEFDQAAANLLRPGSGEPSGRFLSGSALHPLPARAGRSNSPLLQSCGEVWEWTSSHYEPYPGYRPFGGDLMEYNGKFMDNQRVLRGGSCASPIDHLRSTYRNFWPASTRFQFSGFRLSRSLF